MSTSQSANVKYSVLKDGIYNPVHCVHFVKAGFISQGYEVAVSDEPLELNTYVVESVEKRVWVIRRIVQTRRLVVTIREYDNDYHYTKRIIVYLFDKLLEQLTHNLLGEYIAHISQRHEEFASQGILSRVPKVSVVWNDETTKKNK